MYRFATCNDLIRLRSTYPQLKFENVYPWGLKHLGYLYVYEQLLNLPKGLKVLEIGAGLSLVFDKLLGSIFDYHMIDTPGFYVQEDFQTKMNERNHTTFLSGLIGKDSSFINNDSFDVVFSVSALEHVPTDEIRAVCTEMYRILKPGGVMVHTIDIFCEERTESVGMKYYQELKASGFIIENSADMQWCVTGAKTVLFEPLEIVYKYYLGKKDDLWTNPVEVPGHSAAILLLAQKGK